MTGAWLLADNKNNNLIAQVVAMVMQFDTASQNKIIQGNKTMRSITFYDKNGDPFCYTEDDCHIYDFDGNPIAYIESESVWNYDGKHLGFMHNGWIIDHSGDYLLFTEQSTGGPLKPFRSLSPLKGLKSLKPLKGLKEFAPMRPLTSLSWSDLTADEFFV